MRGGDQEVLSPHYLLPPTARHVVLLVVSHSSHSPILKPRAFLPLERSPKSSPWPERLCLVWPRLCPQLPPTPLLLSPQASRTGLLPVPQTPQTLRALACPTPTPRCPPLLTLQVSLKHPVLRAGWPHTSGFCTRQPSSLLIFAYRVPPPLHGQPPESKDCL